MIDQRKTEMKVGFTVVLGIVILLGGFAAFKEWSLLSSQKRMVLRFPVSAGLQTGDEVALNGVDIGKVESVALDKSSVIVYASIDSDVEILEGASAAIQMLELMGGKKIEIMQGAGPGVFPADAVLEGSVDPDIAGALHLIGNLEGNVRELGENANELLQNANTIVGDEAFIASLKDAAVNLRALVIETRSVLGENRNDIRELAVSMNRLTRNVDTLITEIEPRVAGTIDRTDGVLASTDTLLVSLNQLTQDIRTGNGLVSKALYDTSLVSRIDKIVTRLDSVLQIVTGGDLKIKIRI